MRTITNTRKAVATLANKINGKIKNLSAAFTKAWQMVKAQIFLTSKVSGTTFHNRQKALAKLARYNPQLVSAELIREVDNQYDNNAVGVHLAANGSNSYQIGYLPKGIAEYIGKLIDNGIKLTATFISVTGGYADAFNYGALVEIQI